MTIKSKKKMEMFPLFVIFFSTFFIKNSVCRDTVIVVHDAECNDPCFRKIFSGKRIIDSYVRRSMECNSLHDCHRMCEYERGFTCEGFNYRSSSNEKNICELTSVPSSRVDINRDFTLDQRCQFYERDWSQRKCYQKKDKPLRPPASYPTQSSNSWWAADPRPISWNSPDRNRGNYGPIRDPVSKGPLPISPPLLSSSPPLSHHPPTTHVVHYGGTFNGNTQLTLDIPRPINSNRRYPSSDPFYNTDDSRYGSGWNGDHRPLPVRPLTSYSPHQNERPVVRPISIDHHNRVPQYGHNRPGHIPSPSASDFSYNGNGYSYGRPVSSGWQNLTPGHATKHPNDRIGYGSDPETNEVGTVYIPANRRPQPPKVGSNWDNYGYSYADGYHTNYIGSGTKYSSPPRHPAVYPQRLPSPPLPPPPTAPSSHSISEQPHYYGQFYNYGSNYGYGARPTVPHKIYPPSRTGPCSARSTNGFKLTRAIVQNSYLTTNVEQCEQLCETQKNFICRTFAYRYSLASTSPFDNCLLSDAAFENLVFYTDLEPDRDYDIYAMMENSKWCQAQPTKTPSTRRPRPPDECFWRVRSGFCMPPSVIKKPIRVDGMGECQVQCVGSRDFTCRSFVFRYETYPANGMPNCFLSDWPAMEIDPKNMQNMDGAELYERGSFGRGCESHQSNIFLSPLYESPSSVAGANKRMPSRIDDASCYADYDRPCKLTSYAVIYAARVASETDCRRKCSTFRRRNTAPCMSYNFRIIDDHLNDNCYLSDVSMRDLRPGLDYTHSQDFNLYVWRESDPKCLLLNDYDDDQQNFHSLNPSIDPEHTSVYAKPYAKPENPYYYEITVAEPNKPGLLPLDPNLSFNDENNNYDERFLYPHNLISPEFSVLQQFTVNGEPCKKGTKCERNPVAAFWSCEPEGAEPGDWDYCCEPEHHCGFSQGYNYPWCYVGPAPEQWRLCNDKYFPYDLNLRPHKPGINRPSYVKDESDPNYRGRHWPITFLHGEAPPNSTDSVALANDVKNEAITNKTIGTVAIVDIKIPSPSSSNHTSKRGLDDLIAAIKKRKEHVTIIPLISNGRRNRTNDKSEIQRVNSRYKKPTVGENVTLNFSPRFSRDGTTGQYFITKKLNTRFPTQPINRNSQSKGTVAKIERITKVEDFTSRDGGVLMYDLTSRKNIEVDDTQVSLKNSNQTIISNATESSWKEIKTIDKSDD